MSRSSRSPGGSTLRLRFGGWRLARFLLAGLVCVWADRNLVQILQTAEKRYAPPWPGPGTDRGLESAAAWRTQRVNRLFNQQLSFQHSDSKKRSRWQDVLKKMQFEGLVVGEG